jgi:methanogen homocitrate synthase
MFSMNPEFVGQQPKVVLGKKSGYASVTTKMKELGMVYPENKERFDLILQKVKQLGMSKKGLLTNTEFKAIVEEVLG